MILASSIVAGSKRRPRAQDHLGHRQRLLGVALFDHLGKALRKIRLVGELREMDRQGIGKGAHPIDRHHLDRAPWAKRARIERFGEADELGGFAIEMAAQFLWLSRTPRHRARIWRRYCETLASVGNGAYRRPAGHRHRQISEACACAGPGCRGAADNRRRHVWRASPPDRRGVSDREMTDRWRPRGRGPRDYGKMASVTGDVARQACLSPPEIHRLRRSTARSAHAQSSQY